MAWLAQNDSIAPIKHPSSTIRTRLAYIRSIYSCLYAIRRVAIYISEKNVGKAPIELDGNSLKVTIKRISDSRFSGFLDLDKQPVAYENKDFLKRYGPEGTVIDPGVEYQDVELVDLPFGIYHIEATVTLPQIEDFANGMTILNVNAEEGVGLLCGARQGG